MKRIAMFKLLLKSIYWADIGDYANKADSQWRYPFKEWLLGEINALAFSAPEGSRIHALFQLLPLNGKYPDEAMRYIQSIW